MTTVPWDKPVTLGLDDRKRDQFLGMLQRAVGKENVLTRVADTMLVHLVDYTGNYGGPAWVVMPGNTAEVAQVIHLLNTFQVPYVIQSGNTGLVGAGVPAEGVELVLSLRRLKTVLPDGATAEEIAASLELKDDEITVLAGTTLGELNAIATLLGLEPPVSIEALDACIGGMVATNAGGTRVIGDGPLRNHIRGLEVVLPDSSILERGMNGLAKDATGPLFEGLMVGTEGTMGAITRVRIRLRPRLPHSSLYMLAVPDIGIAVKVAGILKDGLADTGRLRVLELMDAASVQLVASITKLEPVFRPEPPPGTLYLIVEIAGDPDPEEEFMGLLEPLIDSGAIQGFRPAGNSADEALFWSYRKVADALRVRANQLSLTVHKLDVSVPLDRYQELVEQVASIVFNHVNGAFFCNYGHMGDGTAHLSVICQPVFHALLSDRVLDLVLRLGGSVSSEHGLGRSGKHRKLAANWLDTWRVLKLALDPQLLMGRGIGPF